MWNGFQREDFRFEGRAATLVVPEKALPNKPWIWRPEFFGTFPSVDIALLKAGYHVAYIDVTNLYGRPQPEATGKGRDDSRKGDREVQSGENHAPAGASADQLPRRHALGTSGAGHVGIGHVEGMAKVTRRNLHRRCLGGAVIANLEALAKPPWKHSFGRGRPLSTRKALCAGVSEYLS